MATSKPVIIGDGAKPVRRARSESPKKVLPEVKPDAISIVAFTDKSGKVTTYERDKHTKLFVAYDYLKENPKDMSLSARELQVKIGVGKSMVSNAKKCIEQESK